MNIDIAASRFPAVFDPVLLDVGHAGSRVVAILDGTGSCEAGDEDERAAAEFLRTTWSANFPGSAAEFIRDVAAAASPHVPVPASDSFGRAGFSLSAVVVMQNGEVFVVSCGSYAAVHVEENVTQATVSSRSVRSSGFSSATGV